MLPEGLVQLSITILNRQLVIFKAISVESRFDIVRKGA
jgi:hypothetical protein